MESVPFGSYVVSVLVNGERKEGVVREVARVEVLEVVEVGVGERELMVKFAQTLPQNTQFKLLSHSPNHTTEFTLLPSKTICLPLTCTLTFPQIPINPLSPRTLYLITNDDKIGPYMKKLDIEMG